MFNDKICNNLVNKTIQDKTIKEDIKKEEFENEKVHTFLKLLKQTREIQPDGVNNMNTEELSTVSKKANRRSTS